MTGLIKIYLVKFCVNMLNLVTQVIDLAEYERLRRIWTTQDEETMQNEPKRAETEFVTGYSMGDKLDFLQAL